MKILARYKDKNNNTCGYLLENEGNRIKLGVKGTRDLVRNGLFPGVNLLKNGEIRGNRGYRIDTINNNSKLEKLGSTLPVMKGKSLTGDVVERKHSYIDITKLKDFSDVKKLDAYDIVDELYDVYDIQNVDDEMAMYDIACALYDDIQFERANFRAYVEKGMNARLMMELRKSAIMPMGEELFSFYTDHSTCETVEDVKAFRIERLQFMCVDYMDLEWQYYYATRHFLGQRGKDLIINFESCYQDCDMSKASNIDTYKREFVINNTPPEWLERERRLAKVCSNREFYT